VAREVVRAHIFISGHVQGIGFRWWVRRLAQDLQLSGWVRNLSDGRVEVIAEGEKKKLTKLIELIKKGPEFSKVDEVGVSWKKSSGDFEKFEIIF
jgi:acylphosphatase